MSTDSRTASPSPLSKSNVLPDQAALKRVFDAEYASALANAKTQLGDSPTLAPRVVETAFVHVWNARATIATSDAVKDVLADEIRHGSARALSRKVSASRLAGGKAAHGAHAAASEVPADVWSHIEKSITTSGVDAHLAADAAGRHEAAAHMKDLSKKKSWAVPIAIGAVALAISVGGVWYVSNLGEDDATLAAVSSSGIQPISSAAGQIGTIKLGDGSTMRIGPDTKVYIADGFATKNRSLKVDGTAEFAVVPAAADKPLTFRVVAKRNHIIATGTNFVVSAYGPDSLVMVQVKEGSVLVKSGKATQTIVANQAIVMQNGTLRPPTADERAEAFGWVDGKVAVQHKKLREAVASLVRWYNIDVKVPDAALLDRDASLSVSLDSSGAAIKQVEESANVKFGYEGGTNRVFRDAGPKKEAAKKEAPKKEAAKKPAATKKK